MEHDKDSRSCADLGQNATENGEHCFDVGVAQNSTTKSPCAFYEVGGEHNETSTTRGRQNQRHDFSALFKSHNTLLSNRPTS